jgi:hypothetical protein
VTPNAFAGSEGPGSINLLPGSGVGQKQLWIISNSQFSTISGSTTISAVEMRPDAVSGAAFGPTTIHNLQITLATTTHSPDDVSSNHNFADYLTGGVTLFSGDVVISSAFTGPAAGPKAFDIVFPFTAPFLYTPTNGNLVVQFAVNSPDGIPTMVDGLQDSTGGFGRLFGAFSNTTGPGDSFTPVLQFAVPEPSALWITGLAIVALARRR